MEHRDRPEVALAQPGGQLLDHHDRAVVAPGAADGDREPVLALLDVGGDEQAVMSSSRDRNAEAMGWPRT